MPYIKQERRGKPPITWGELNYKLTKEILESSLLGLADRLVGEILEFMTPTESYEKYQSVIGLIECMRMEFTRRMGNIFMYMEMFDKVKNEFGNRLAKYEDKKKEENGDVFP